MGLIELSSGGTGSDYITKGSEGIASISPATSPSPAWWFQKEKFFDIPQGIVGSEKILQAFFSNANIIIVDTLHGEPSAKRYPRARLQNGARFQRFFMSFSTRSSVYLKSYQSYLQTIEQVYGGSERSWNPNTTHIVADNTLNRFVLYSKEEDLQRLGWYLRDDSERGSRNVFSQGRQVS